MGVNRKLCQPVLESKRRFTKLSFFAAEVDSIQTLAFCVLWHWPTSRSTPLRSFPILFEDNFPSNVILRCSFGRVSKLEKMPFRSEDCLNLQVSRSLEVTAQKVQKCCLDNTLNLKIAVLKKNGSSCNKWRSPLRSMIFNETRKDYSFGYATHSVLSLFMGSQV